MLQDELNTLFPLDLQLSPSNISQGDFDHPFNHPIASAIKEKITIPDLSITVGVRYILITVLLKASVYVKIIQSNKEVKSSDLDTQLPFTLNITTHAR